MLNQNPLQRWNAIIDINLAIMSRMFHLFKNYGPQVSNKFEGSVRPTDLTDVKFM